MEEVEEGLRFYGIGGAGRITCNECGLSEEITSFVHGTGAIKQPLILSSQTNLQGSEHD